MLESNYSFEVVGTVLVTITRYIQQNLFPVYTSFLRSSGIDPQTLTTRQVVNTMFGTLRDLLNYTPHVSPDAFIDHIDGDKKDLNKIQYHRIRTVRIYCKLLSQLQQKWIDNQSRALASADGFLVLLPKHLRSQRNLPSCWASGRTEEEKVHVPFI